MSSPARNGGLRIVGVRAGQILDSRGNPTIRVALALDDGSVHAAAAPAGASTGANEALELRDGDPEWGGRGVLRAVAAAEGELAGLLTAHPWGTLAELDAAMRALDGTARLGRLGANTIVALSVAACRCFAHAAGLPVHGWIARETGSSERLPVPHFNVLNGGAHAANALDFQEFLLAPIAARSFAEALRRGAAAYHALAGLIRDRHGSAGLGDEGGFAPAIDDPEDALRLLEDAIDAAGLTAATDDLALALDPAANGFRTGTGYRLAGRDLTAGELLERYVALADAHPVWSLEDGFAEDDEEGWALQRSRLGGRLQLVGDDLYVTDPARIAAGGERGLSTAVLLKPNQVGTVSDTLEAVRVARAHGMACMVSHRSGETLDDFIADLAVGTGVGQIKAGAPARGERVAKYNRLAAIAEAHPELPYGLGEAS